MLECLAPKSHQRRLWLGSYFKWEYRQLPKVHCRGTLHQLRIALQNFHRPKLFVLSDFCHHDDLAGY